ncbi:hypothetical protein KIPB_013551, partial [Kipferlia bialata]
QSSGAITGSCDTTGSTHYNCIYVEFVTDGGSSDFEGITMDYCINFWCATGWMGRYWDLFTASYIVVVLLVYIVASCVFHTSGASGTNQKNPGIMSNTKEHFYSKDGGGSVCMRTQPVLNARRVELLSFIGLHRRVLDKPYTLLYILTLGGLGFWWALDMARIDRWVREANYSTNGWTKRLKHLEGGQEHDISPSAVLLEDRSSHLASDPVADGGCAAMSFSPKGMGHSGQGRPVFVYTGPLGEDRTSPAETLGEGEAYTALLIG